MSKGRAQAANQQLLQAMAIRLDFDPIEFLLRRRFGSDTIHPFSALPARGRSTASAPNDEEELLRKREAYEKELRELLPDELNERVRVAKEKDEAAREARFSFNRPSALANAGTYDHWAKAAYWKEDEAVALLIERNPNSVNWKCVQYKLDISQVADRFAQLRELVLRAQTMGQLARYTIPGFFLAWAKRNQIDVPPGLEEAVRNHGHQVADWKTAYDEQVARTVAAEAALLELRQQTDALEQTPAEKGLSTRERESLLKLVIGMAVDGYGYDPAAARSPIPKEIADQLAARGLPLDQDTVRKYLKEAGELLPRQDDDDT